MRKKLLKNKKVIFISGVVCFHFFMLFIFFKYVKVEAIPVMVSIAAKKDIEPGKT